MKFIIAALALTSFSNLAFAYGDVYVQGYQRSNGTYVAPHMRSAPDGNSYNNWSTSGNVNPYTGQEGHKNPSSNSFGTYGAGFGGH